MTDERGDGARVAYPLFQTGDGGSCPTSPLQLQVGRIERSTFQDLNKLWHSRLPLTRNCFEGICFGGHFNGKYYAVAWWSKPIAQNRLKNGRCIYELRRFAIAPDAPLHTASRMLKVMTLLIKRDLTHITKLISYQDTEVHKGTIYKASGWTPVETKGKFLSWKNRNDFDRIDQSEAVKIRWEKEL